MRIESQHSAELAQLGGLIANMPVAMLNHLDARGVLHSRPIAPLELDGDGALWFFTDLGTAQLEYLRIINLSFSDPARVTYVSISARAEIQTDRAHIERLWTPLASPWFPAGPDSTNLALLKVMPTVAEVWDVSHHRMTPVWAMVTAVTAGEPLALGEYAARPALPRVSTSLGLR